VPRVRSRIRHPRLIEGRATAAKDQLFDPYRSALTANTPEQLRELCERFMRDRGFERFSLVAGVERQLADRIDFHAVHNTPAEYLAEWEEGGPADPVAQHARHSHTPLAWDWRSTALQRTSNVRSRPAR